MDKITIHKSVVVGIGISISLAMGFSLLNPSVLLTPMEVNQYDKIDAGSYSDTTIHEDKVFIIEDVRIIYETDLRGERVGKNYDEIDRTIYLEDGLSPDRLKEVCEHEVMHMKGIGEEDHEYIRENSDSVNSDICNRFMFELGVYLGEN